MEQPADTPAYRANLAHDQAYLELAPGNIVTPEVEGTLLRRSRVAEPAVVTRAEPLSDYEYVLWAGIVVGESALRANPHYSPTTETERRAFDRPMRGSTAVTARHRAANKILDLGGVVFASPASVDA